jgi:tRNA pseudouridine65 synthase
VSDDPAAPPVLHVLHADDDLLVISKPAGMLVHRDERGPWEHVALNTAARQTGRYLYPVHRLDRNTSGVLCFACSPEMAAAAQARLGDEDTIKEYLALVRGETPERFESDRPLTNDRGERRPARTTFERAAVYDRCSLLRVRIHTGRHHQIRRHLNHLGHHVIGDTTHGKGRINRHFREAYGLPRMFLHAHRLVIAHPRTGERLEIVDPLPADLQAVLDALATAG